MSEDGFLEGGTCGPGLHCKPLQRAEAEQLSAMLRTIADPTRLQLFRLLEQAPNGEACVCDLADSLELRQSTVSHHLKIMTEAGLLDRERRGTWAWFSVNHDGLQRIRSILDPAPRASGE
ncbi:MULTISPECIES: ArsR/SmtB family transcription factor [Streptomyces]|jgi:ArsR family transcriptional regulator|uniref:Metalloregulator ArsR/SmtB family transcription factor n=1 Tax=Streptomyces ortus TaxID=2867268 RepID=A0ABT3V3S1_9ACTN|nr:MULTISPECIES: metalloregulator ArsR/SmtB family transcription factor [Streptomyces]MCX4233295.1 metalloregulator ArsR/SmtB family transcription factor [Streptomyces ortus]